MSIFNTEYEHMPASSHICRWLFAKKKFFYPEGLSFFILAFFICTLLAQREKIDSLKNVLPALKDAARIDCLNALSKAHVCHQTDSSKMFAQKALEEAEKINYQKGFADAWLNLARTTGLSGHDLRAMGMQITARRIEMLQQENNFDAQIKLADLMLPDGAVGGTEVLLKIPVCYD